MNNNVRNPPWYINFIARTQREWNCNSVSISKQTHAYAQCTLWFAIGWVHTHLSINIGKRGPIGSVNYKLSYVASATTTKSGRSRPQQTKCRTICSVSLFAMPFECLAFCRFSAQTTTKFVTSSDHYGGWESHSLELQIESLVGPCMRAHFDLLVSRCNVWQLQLKRRKLATIPGVATNSENIFDVNIEHDHRTARCIFVAR